MGMAFIGAPMEKAVSCGERGGAGFDFGVRQVRGYVDSLLMPSKRREVPFSGVCKEPIFRAAVNSVADVTHAMGCSPGPALQPGPLIPQLPRVLPDEG